MAYEESRIGVDAIILSFHEGKLKVFLHRREKDPFLGKYEVLGGLLHPNETAEDAIKRKIKEMFFIEHIFIKQFKTFTDPNRDPRQRTISIGFISLINSQVITDFSSWHDMTEIKDLAFDHELMIKESRSFLLENLESSIIKHLLREYFPLNKLQEIFEIISKKNYDNRNFRRKVINNGLVIETKKYEKKVSHRPAKLYKFK